MIETQTIGYISRDVLESLMGMVYGRGQWFVEIEDRDTIVVWIDMEVEPDSGSGLRPGVPRPTKRTEIRLRPIKEVAR